MGRRGPPPLPTRIKEMRGTLEKSRQVVDEYVPTVGCPTLPAWLDAEGRAEWRRIVAELDSRGMLSAIHASSLADLCAAHSTAVKGQKKLAREGLVIQTHVGPKPNPLVAIIREARTQANALRREFGLTPSAASRVSAPQKPAADDAKAKEDLMFGPPRLVRDGTGA